MPATDRQHFLANIMEQNERQKQLIDKLLALVKLEKQQSLSSVAAVDVPALLAQVAQDAAAHLAAQNQTLVQSPLPCTILGDLLLLRQALGNLLDNASDFAPPCSVLRIECRLQPEANEAHGMRPTQKQAICVIDDGPGIPEYARERIFERFYSLPRPHKAKSTGLGLPFVREVALLHGGTVDIQNRPQGGVCACLQLPLGTK